MTTQEAKDIVWARWMNDEALYGLRDSDRPMCEDMVAFQAQVVGVLARELGERLVEASGVGRLVEWLAARLDR